MNTLIKAIILSLSSALVAAPVMAAPQEHHSQQHTAQHHIKKTGWCIKKYAEKKQIEF